MPKQIQRLLIVFAIFISLFLIARHFLVPKTFGDLGHYRADALKDNKDHEMKYIDTAQCSTCHADISSVKYAGVHKKINCQTCHGAGSKHIGDPTNNLLDKPTEREFCGKCHSKNIARPSSVIKQIDLTKHNVGNKCVKCHNPHTPEIKIVIAGVDSKKDDPAVCIACHEKINNIKMTGKHKPLACQICHGSGLDHIKAPSTKNITKPSKREFCGKCHGKGLAPASNFIKQIDLKEHNTDNKCVECHIAHNPLEFK